jgi:hypothetical protein
LGRGSKDFKISGGVRLYIASGFSGLACSYNFKMSEEEEKTESAPTRAARPAEGPSLVLMMEDVVERLKFLNYED